MPGADAHPLMKSDADRLRDARWGAKLNGWLAAVRSAPPRYCLCSGFAVGDMIRCEGGCDGWFHLACLGLAAAPRCALWPSSLRKLAASPVSAQWISCAVSHSDRNMTRPADDIGRARLCGS